MKRRRPKDKARRRRTERREKRRRSSSTPRPAPVTDESEYELPAIPGVRIDPPERERCFESIHVGESFRRVADPYRALGVDPAAGSSPEEIRAAWCRAIELHPPEREPERAREVTAARDRLLAPERFVERRIGVLYPPDPAAHGLPVPAGPPAPAERLPARARLLGQLALYALLEEELRDEKPPLPRQGELPF